MNQLERVSALLRCHERPSTTRFAAGLASQGWTDHLKLQVYRSLGIDVSQDATTGDFNRAVLRNYAKGDVNIVNVNDNVGKKFYADMFWESL